jgi:Flp pilus assembly protein TadG
MRRANRGGRGLSSTGTGQGGQSLVEFALVFPIFFGALMALVEFAFGFNAVLSVSFASRNAAVIAAEASNSASADCSILKSIEDDFDAPASAKQISKVSIYWTNANGQPVSGVITTYTRSTTSTIACSIGGLNFNVPYVLTTNGYPPSLRCGVRTGCGSGHLGLDTIGVQITYAYSFLTPYGAVLGGKGWTVDRSDEMRVEPYQ